jgi:hypothetical protein
MTKPITFRFLIAALLVAEWLCGATVRATSAPPWANEARKNSRSAA